MVWVPDTETWFRSNAGLWNWRVTKEEDKTKARRGYFKAPITGRNKQTPRPSRQKKDTHPERSQRKNRKLSDQTKPARAKVDITDPEDTQEPAKTKAKKDGETNIEENSAASSVEIVDEIFNLPGQPVTREQESEDLEEINKT